MNPPLPSFVDTSVLIIGDVMLDSFRYGETKRTSPEVPVPVVHVEPSNPAVDS